MAYLDLLVKLKPLLTDQQYHTCHRLYLASEGEPRLRQNVELALQAQAIGHLGKEFFEDESAYSTQPAGCGGPTRFAARGAHDPAGSWGALSGEPP